MNRYLSVFRLCAFPTFFSYEDDYYGLTVDPEEFTPKTGLQRVRRLFTANAYGSLRAEYISALQITGGSFVFGFVYGGFQKAKLALDNFIAINQTTRFISPWEGKRRLRDHVMLTYFRAGSIYGVKTAIFTAIFSFTVIIIAAYRDKDGIIEYTIGGLLAGLAARFHFGPKAALVAAGLGAVFCTFFGILTFLSSKIFNVSMNDARQMQYDLYLFREKKIKENMLKMDQENKKPVMVAEHDMRLQRKDTSGYKPDDDDAVYVVVDPKNDSELVTKSTNLNMSTKMVEVAEEKNSSSENKSELVTIETDLSMSPKTAETVKVKSTS